MQVQAPSIAPRSRPTVLLAALLAAGLLAACEPESTAEAGLGGDQGTVQREVRDLLTALTPFSASALPTEKSDWYASRRAALERMRTLGRAYGEEALRVYREEPPKLPEQRAGLLDVAGHTAPDLATPLLEELVTRFGEDMLVRTNAALYLGECAPERAVEVLEPLLEHQHDGRTYPPEERLLSAWITAYDKLGRDPVTLLAAIATDLNRDQDVRHLATRTLGEHDSPLSRQALRVLLVESSGNGYIRRLACQSLIKILPREEACSMLQEVQSHEADTEFILFLESALVSNCR